MPLSEPVRCGCQGRGRPHEWGVRGCYRQPQYVIEAAALAQPPAVTATGTNRTALIRQQQRDGGGPVTSVMVSRADEAPTLFDAAEVVRMLEGIRRAIEVMGEDGECSLRTIRGVQYVTKDDAMHAVDDRLGVVRLRALAAATPPAIAPAVEPGAVTRAPAPVTNRRIKDGGIGGRAERKALRPTG